MKKIIASVLAFALVLSTLFLASCGAGETLKFGMGVYSYYSAPKDATEDSDGSVTATSTVAAVLVDADGKVVDIELDTIEYDLAFTNKGAFAVAGTLMTKAEKGDAYGMKAWGGSAKEWYEQADAFESIAVGKTLEQIKALVAADGDKGSDDVIAAGCTISVSDFIKAIEKAFVNLEDSTATKSATVKIGAVAVQEGSKNAGEDHDGVNEIDVTFVATAKSEGGKVAAMVSDMIQSKAEFDASGKAKTTAADAISTKRELGDTYGMKAWGNDRNEDGKVGEWYEQADAFESFCIGKTASEIEAFAAGDGYGVADLQSAGCTILVTDFIKAAVKSLK